MWDSLHLSRVNLLKFSDNQRNPEPFFTSVEHRSYLSAATPVTAGFLKRRLHSMEDPTVTKDPATSSIPTLQYENRQPESGTSEETTSPQVISSEPSIRYCFGKDLGDNIRLSIGPFTQAQLETISSLHQLHSKEGFIERLCQTISDSTQYRLHIWRKKDYTLWNTSLPDGACGWYTIANLHRRAQSLPLLNFHDQGERTTGVNLIKETASNASADAELLNKLISAYHWLSSDRLSSFPAQDQLSTINFGPLTGDIRTAVYMTPPYSDSPRMQSPNWMLLYHHTASPIGSATPTISDLLLLARDSNYAQLVDHHFWPLPV